MQELQKLEENKFTLQKRKEAAAAQQERLDKAVENYSCRPQAEADPERVLKEIEAMTLRKGIELDKADKVKMFTNNSFTADALMKDVRYKISSALHSAGLENSSYAHQVMKGLDGHQNHVQQNVNTKGLF